jgi:hypothetical protein
VSGATPSHPELLDWLATEFVRSGWSIKHMHRLILTSATWRQRSGIPRKDQTRCESVDSENQLLWRFHLRRLDAEALRDSRLEVAGTLNRKPFHNAMAVARQPSGEVRVPDTEDQNLRSIYLKVLRLNPESLLEAFDRPTMSVNCTQRSTSTVSTQALTLLNSDIMARVSAAFANRVLKERPDDPVRRAVLTAFSRPAAEDEVELMNRFLEQQQKQYLSELKESDRADTETPGNVKKKAMTDLCHMLMSANEFAYVD